MKKTFTLITICGLNILNSFAQDPQWLWAKSAGGINIDGALSLDIDENHNVYIAGAFLSDQISIGSYTLFNSKVGGGSSDIFIAKYDPSGNVLWAKSAGGATGSLSASDYGRDIATDIDGNIYFTGWFESDTIMFGSTVLTHSPLGNIDIFIVKYNASGNVIWAKTTSGGNNATWSNSVISLSDGICLTGYFTGETVFDNDTLLNNGLRDIFLVKYDTNGNVVWAKSEGEIGSLSDDEGNHISSDANDNLYMTGFFTGTSLLIGTNNLNNNGINTQDFFITKYDGSGNVIWAKSAGGANDDFGKSVTNGNGNTYVTGSFKSPSIVFGSTTLANTTTNNKADIFIVKYDISGNVEWAKNAGGTADDGVWNIKSDADDNVYVTGWFGSEISFGNITLTNSETDGSFDIFIAKYSSSGDVLWALNVGGSGNDYGRDVESDDNGNLYVTGGFNSPVINFGNTALPNTDNSGSTSDIFIAKLDINTGIEDFQNSNVINIYPNPSNKIIKVSSEENISAYCIYYLSGRMIISKTLDKKRNFELDVSSFNSGLYYLKLETEKGNIIKKFVKE